MVEHEEYVDFPDFYVCISQIVRVRVFVEGVGDAGFGSNLTYCRSTVFGVRGQL